jgi:hypothetical protein
VKESKDQINYHPDLWIMLIIIPFISAFNYYLTYSNIQPNFFLLLTFSLDTAQGYLAWWGVRAVILYLDQKTPYTKSFLKRVLTQIPLTIFVGLGIIALSTELISWLYRGKSAHISFYLVDLFIISIWFWVINGIYIGIYFYRQWEFLHQQKDEIAFETAKNQQFVVKVGNQSNLIKVEDIWVFFVENEYVQLMDKNSKKYILDASLDKIEKQLPTSDFFRINRQCILNRQIISGFKRIENGKLTIQLNFSFDLNLELTVSRIKAPAFKAWFLSNHYISS